VAIVSAFGTNVMPEDAELHILGVTLGCIFFANDLNRIERMRGYPPSRSHDVGIVIGPVITTPDELEETTIQDLGGRRYKLTVTATVNEEEVFRFDTNDLPITLTDAVCFASTTAGVRSGDVIAIDLGAPTLKGPLQSKDEIRVTCDWLGTLASRVG
jgi:2-keto-4-pentenoate hydratase/2-oxohepta-3-ene-1,7-dioic acid hydratase in catechol pathway